MNPETTLLKKTKETKSERKIVELTVCKSAISINSQSGRQYWLNLPIGAIFILCTRNPASRASMPASLVAMYIAVAIRPSSYVHRVTSEVAVSFLPEVVAQI